MFTVGVRVVDKKTGYKFPGVVVAVFKKLDGSIRFVVEMEGYGLLHIFSEKDLKDRK